MDARPDEEVAARPREHDGLARGVDALIAELGRGLANPLPRVAEVFGQVAGQAASVVVQQSWTSPGSIHALQW